MNKIDENRADKNKKVAVLLTRAQPFTRGHEELVKQMLKEVGNVCVVIGSADKEMTERNPFSASKRLYWTVNILKEHTENTELFEFEENYDRVFRSEHLTVFALPDWESEDNTTTLHQWGSYLYYNIVSRVQSRNLVFYYCDNPDTIQSWFDESLSEYITYRLQDREKLLPGISSTKAREALLKSYHSDVADFHNVFNYLSPCIDMGYYGVDYMASIMKRVQNKKQYELKKQEKN